jgi:hypothetical protein
MTAAHDVEHPVFAELIQPVDEHDLAELLANAVAAEGWHPTYDHDSEGAIGE